MMHTSEDFTLDQIQKHLRIKEETRIREKNLNGASSYKELHLANVTTTDNWWYDSGATTYVCNNRDLFKTYKETKDGHEVMMGDNHTLKFIGSGNVEIQFTSGKKLTLMNVLHVPIIRKNLVSGFELCKSGVPKQLGVDVYLELNTIQMNPFKLLKLEEANTPCESSCKLVENNGRAVAQIEYASAIGCLMYATRCTIPDTAYAVCKLSRYTSNPSQDHWKAIKRTFGYLKRTRQLALYYDHFPAVVEGYSYASWITGSSDSKSTTDGIFTLGGGAVC
nr:zinc finger, CCHC-type [Tanacetum cinerariifolium]